MKLKAKIRQDVSQIFDVLIPENRWQEYMDMLDKDGHPNRRELLALLLAYGKHIESLESYIEDVYFKIELLEGNKEAIAPKAPEIKLRTPIDVQTDLDHILTPETTRFYLSLDDWKILEKTVNLELAKTDPVYGYGKEVDPKDNTEKVCLYYKDHPVFKKSD